ncbi:hypothetical protein [Brevibacterium antiquum]
MMSDRNAAAHEEAQRAYRRAIELTTDPAERAYLETRSLEARSGR